MNKFSANLPKRFTSTSEKNKGSEKKSEPNPEKKRLGDVIAQRLKADTGKKKTDQKSSLFEEKQLPNIETVKTTPSNSEQESSSNHEGSDDFDDSVRRKPLQEVKQFQPVRPSTARSSVRARPVFSPRQVIAKKVEGSEKPNDDLLQSLLQNLKSPEDTEVQKRTNTETASSNSDELRLVDSEGSDATPSNVPRPSDFKHTIPSDTAKQNLAISSRNLDAIDGAKMARAAKVERKRQAFKRVDAKILATTTDASSIRKHLPPGMIMDIHGNVSGTYTFTHHAEETTFNGRRIEYSGEHFDVVLNSIAAKQISEPTFIDGLKVSSWATRDFPRMSYAIPTDDGQSDPLPKPSDEQIAIRAKLITKQEDKTPIRSDISSAREQLRSEQIALALRNFANDDKVAFALSCAMVQQIPTQLQGVVYHATSPFRAITSGMALDNDRNPRPLTIKNPYGQEQPAVVVGLGGVFALSRDGDNFKLNFDYTTYARPKDLQLERELPLHHEGVIGVHFNAEIFINGDAARKGTPELTMPNGVQVTYSGRFKLD